MTFISSCCYVYRNSYAQSILYCLPPFITGTNMKLQTTEKYYELDNSPPLEDILQGKCRRIHVTGWDEANEWLEKEEKIYFIKYDDYETYWQNRFYCSTTEDGFLPL